MMSFLKNMIDLIENIYLKAKIRLMFLWDKKGYDELMESFKKNS